MSDTREAVQRRSWETNADAWTCAVREQHIPSRRVGTDAAIVWACERIGGRRVLDVGCREGWSSRALCDAVVANGEREVLGIDASEGLTARAGTNGGETGASGPRDQVIAYDDVVHRPAQVAGPFDLIVCNFALLGDPVGPLLAALASRLAPHAHLLVQTVHPWTALGDVADEHRWREERFQGDGVQCPVEMPRFFRTLASWYAEFCAAGLIVTAVDEPLHPATGRSLSLMFTCVRSAV